MLFSLVALVGSVCIDVSVEAVVAAAAVANMVGWASEVDVVALIVAVGWTFQSNFDVVAEAEVSHCQRRAVVVPVANMVVYAVGVDFVEFAVVVGWSPPDRATLAFVVVSDVAVVGADVVVDVVVAHYAAVEFAAALAVAEYWDADDVAIAVVAIDFVADSSGVVVAVEFQWDARLQHEPQPE